MKDKRYIPKYKNIYSETDESSIEKNLLTYEEDKKIIKPEYRQYQWTPYSYSDNPYYKQSQSKHTDVYKKFIDPKEKTKKLVKQASETKSNYLDEIFGINNILRSLGASKGPILLFLILWLLLCFHIAFGYTVTLKRLIIAFSLAIGSMAMLILFNLIIKDLKDYPTNKYFLVPLTLVIFLIGCIRITYLLLINIVFKHYKTNTYIYYP